MTLKELHTKLGTMLRRHGSKPIFHPAAPWGCPFEVDQVTVTEIASYVGGKKQRGTGQMVVILNDSVGD